MVVRCILREFRKAHKVTLPDLAVGTGLRPATLSEMERGLTKGIEYATLNQIVAWFRARGIACEVGDLLTYEAVAEGEGSDGGRDPV